MRHQTFVMLNGNGYRVTWDGEGRVLGVEQQIVPLRHASYWRTLNHTSKAAAAAVEAAVRKQAERRTS